MNTLDNLQKLIERKELLFRFISERLKETDLNSIERSELVVSKCEYKDEIRIMKMIKNQLKAMED